MPSTGASNERDKSTKLPILPPRYVTVQSTQVAPRPSKSHGPPGCFALTLHLLAWPMLTLATWPILESPLWPMYREVSSCILGADPGTKEASMELTWKSYGVTLETLRRQVEERVARAVGRASRPASPRQHREGHREHLLASGSRYVSPIR
jgi:hypothetical protein